MAVTRGRDRSRRRFQPIGLSVGAMAAAILLTAGAGASAACAAQGRIASDNNRLESIRITFI